jgi:hypothetical protein
MDCILNNITFIQGSKFKKKSKKKIKKKSKALLRKKKLEEKKIKEPIIDIINDNFEDFIDNNDIIIEDDIINMLKPTTDENETCIKCKLPSKQLLNTGEYVCVNCGYMDNITIDTEKPSYKSQNNENTYYVFKRENHFENWLLKIQGIENFSISHNEILLIKEKIERKNIHNINAKTLKIILKELNMNKYYDHIQFVINILNGNTDCSKIISENILSQIKNMFQQIHNTFLIIKPKDRHNFMNYPYIIFKIFELLELDYFLENIPKLQRNSLKKLDKFWKDICNQLNWEFYPSI